MQPESLRQFGQVDFLPMFIVLYDDVESYGSSAKGVEAILSLVAN